jgi:N-acetylglutamate synthase-like GNAT family acetyltransferase
MQFQQEFFCDCYDEAKELLNMHYDEIALNKDLLKLNPSIEQYETAEKNGILKIFTARSEGKIVGYFAVLVNKSLHYQDHLYATNDVIFLHPDHRKGYTASKLIKFSIECLAQDGVSMLFMNTKIHKPFDLLLQRLGFQHIENVYTKRLI